MADALSAPVGPLGGRSRGNGAGGSGVLAVGLLGPLEVSVDGRPVGLTTGRLQTLLALLALRAGEAVSVPRLAGAMWDGDLPADPRRTVQTYLARLRGLLSGSLIAPLSGGYVLRAEPDQVDALRFLRLLDAAAAAQEPSEERALLVEAIGLWRGAPFDGIRSAWPEHSQTPRLVEAYLGAVERQVDLDLADGRHGGLVAPLRELVARYPLRSRCGCGCWWCWRAAGARPRRSTSTRWSAVGSPTSWAPTPGRTSNASMPTCWPAGRPR